MSPKQITEADLHAYLDAQLADERRVEVEAYLAAQPAEAERLLAYQTQKNALRQYFNPVLDETLPPALLEQIEAPPVIAPAPRRSAAVNAKKQSFLTRCVVQRMAAGLALALLGGALGWLGRGQYQVAVPLAQMAPLSRQAAVAHAVFSPDLKRPVEVTADQEEQLVKWLSKRLGAQIKPPKLAALGYELIGGRLLPGSSGPVAQFMYQEASGQRLTLYLSTEKSVGNAAGFRFAQEGTVKVFYWIDGKFGYALSAEIDKSELAQLATAVYDQLESR